MMNIAVEKNITCELSKNVLLKMKCNVPTDELLSKLQKTDCRRQIDRLAKVDNSEHKFEIIIENFHEFYKFVDRKSIESYEDYCINSMRTVFLTFEKMDEDGFCKDVLRDLEKNYGFGDAFYENLDMGSFSHLDFTLGTYEHEYITVSSINELFKEISDLKECIERNMKQYTIGERRVDLVFSINLIE